MKRFTLGAFLLLIVVPLFAVERPMATTPEITAPVNGADWLKLSSTEKLFWSIGYSQGYQDALMKIDVASGPNTQCASLAARTERQSSTAGKVTGFELVSGLEKFYSNPANTMIPVGSAIRIYLLQASGKDQTTIEELIETARTLGAESSRRAGSAR